MRSAQKLGLLLRTKEVSREKEKACSRGRQRGPGLSQPGTSTTETGVAFTSSPTFPGQTAKRKLNTLIKLPVWSRMAAHIPCMLVSAREHQSWKAAQDPSGSPAFRKCLSFLVCRKGKSRQEVSHRHQVRSHAALALAALLQEQNHTPF